MAFCSLNYLIKKLRETGTTDRQPGSGRPWTSRTAENIDAVNDLVLSQEGAQTKDTQNYPSDRQGNWHFVEISGTQHTHRHSAKVPEETSRAQESTTSNRASFDQWRDRLNACVKTKGKHVEHLL